MVIKQSESSVTNTAKEDSRLARLTEWLTVTLQTDALSVETASADASFRRYFRVRHGRARYVAMDAPPDREDCRPFVAVCDRLRRCGLNAPRIHKSDLSLGFLLLDDLGDTQYLTGLSTDTVESLYGDALDALLRIQTRVPADDLPPYDRRLLRKEMDLFVDWFLRKHLGIAPDKAMKATFEHTFGLLIDNALEQPRVFVHRDFHSRNLMIVDAANPGILDFQDAVHGPVTYDLVSLLRDCYIAWGDDKIRRWVDKHYRRLKEAGVINADPPTFERWFDWMGVQRHLKAIGIFARLNHRDGKPDYLDDVPRTFGYVRDTCARYAQLRPFYELLRALEIGRRLGL